MMLELHHVTIGQQIRGLSATVSGGQMLSVTGQTGSGKTTLLRAVLGFVAIDGGHISIDGELLTPRSAPYFRRQTAYVPQFLSLPEGYHDVPTDYVQLVEQAVQSGKQLLVVDEPAEPLSDEKMAMVDQLLQEALERGAIVLAVNQRTAVNQIAL